jgi:hypothetical protein
MPFDQRNNLPPEDQDLENVRHVIRAARELGILICDNPHLATMVPHDSTCKDGIDYFTPRGAVEFCL